MQSAEDPSNLMDTDHNVPLSASSSPVLTNTNVLPSSVIVVSAAAAGTSTPGGASAVVTSGAIPTAASRTIESLDYHCRKLEEELQATKESETKLKQQYAESQRRERILARRLAVKEQEMQDFATQIAELKSAQAPGQAALRSALLDPAVNILFQKLKLELQQTNAKLEETQNELSAWKFTPDSNTGKRLMAKCRLLYQENEELGKMTSNGRLAKLEGELALAKSYSEELKKSQLELDDLMQEMDEDVEGMQSTIVFLQTKLKHTTEEKECLEKEVHELRAYVSGGPRSGLTLNEGPPPTTLSDCPNRMETDSSEGGKMYLVNGSNNKLKNSEQAEPVVVVFQNRTHCGGNNSSNSSNPELQLQNGDDDNGEELVNSSSSSELLLQGEQTGNSRLAASSGGNNVGGTGNSKKAHSNRTATAASGNRTVGGKKRAYAEEHDEDEAAAAGVTEGGDDEEDSGHYDDGSNNCGGGSVVGKMLAPDGLEHQQLAASAVTEDELLHSGSSTTSVSSNKRMTRSGKGKPAAPSKALSTVTTAPVSAKKLRRTSVLTSEPTPIVADAGEEESEAFVAGANGAN